MTGFTDSSIKSLDENRFKQVKSWVVEWLNQLVDNIGGGLADAIFGGNVRMVAEMRRDLVNTHAVFLHSIALASNSLVVNRQGEHPELWRLECLKNVPVDKVSKVWARRTVNSKSVR